MSGQADHGKNKYILQAITSDFDSMDHYQTIWHAFLPSNNQIRVNTHSCIYSFVKSSNKISRVYSVADINRGLEIKQWFKTVQYVLLQN